LSTFNETITLTNVKDEVRVEAGMIKEIRAALGLKITDTSTATLADGSIGEYPITEPVEFRWKNRKQTMGAMVIPDADEVLLGALCMEALDVMQDPVDECLKGRHGDKAIYKVK
jgi:hypothetical protein